jgi:predicted P-loop ATPase
VFPCAKRDKVPITKNGFLDASTDAKQIRAWWSKDPEANIGVPTGERSALVLDVDTPEALEEVLRRKPPDTVVSVTGRGGRHFLFKRTKRFGNKKPLIAGCDRRGDGGYIVVPPSIHELGTRYQWEVPPFNGTALADPPQWFFEVKEPPQPPPPPMLGGTPWGKRVLEGECEKMRSTPEGGRNQTLNECAFRVGSALVAGGLDYRTAEDALVAAARAAGLSASEARKTAASGLSSGQKSPREPQRRGSSMAQCDAADPNAWRTKLLLTKTNGTRSCTANACLILREHEDLAGIIRYDQFRERIWLSAEPPWGGAVSPRAWTDEDTTGVLEMLDREGLTQAREYVVYALDHVAREQGWHPVRHYLDGLSWDGVERIATWGATYLGAEPTLYHLSVCERWLISAVARIYSPSVKVDHVLVLEGRQGLGKSTALSILGGAWYSDEMPEFGSKDACIQASAAWIHELAELATLARSQVEATKAFISRQVDRFRPPYGRQVVERPRQCVFAATTNTRQYLLDETGNRRWWPVRCGDSIDMARLKDDRDQLWAEAVRAYRLGRPHWLDVRELEDAAGEAQDERRQDDPWSEPIRAWLTGQNEVSVSAVLEHALGLEVGRRDGFAGSRAGRCLRGFGWELVRRKRSDGSRAMVWRRPMTGEQVS